MGDRALIQFKTKDEVSPVIYTHWHGSKVTRVLRVLKNQMRTHSSDLSYVAARMVGLLCELSGIHDELGVGIKNLTRELMKGESQGDNGIYIVSLPEWEVKHIER